MINLVHLRSFLAIVDAKGVRAAARELELAPSTVVEHVRQLENDLSVPLLVRAHPVTEATREGERLLPYARALVRTASQLGELIRIPSLRLSASSNVGTYMLQQPLAAFFRRSGIDADLWIGPNPDVAARLERGEADVAVMEWWDGRKGFRATTWKQEPLVVIVAPDHPWADRSVVEPDDLVSETLLGGEGGSGTGRILREQLGSLADRFKTRTGWGSTEAIKRAVQAGFGISIVMSSSVADEVASGRLVALPVSGVSFMKEIKVVLPEAQLRSSAAVEFLNSCCRDLEDA